MKFSLSILQHRDFDAQNCDAHHKNTQRPDNSMKQMQNSSDESHNGNQYRPRMPHMHQSLQAEAKALREHAALHGLSWWVSPAKDPTTIRNMEAEQYQEQCSTGLQVVSDAAS